MADTDVTGSIRFSDGSSVPLENLAMTESATGLASTAVELQTDASFYSFSPKYWDLRTR